VIGPKCVRVSQVVAPITHRGVARPVFGSGHGFFWTSRGSDEVRIVRWESAIVPQSRDCPFFKDELGKLRTVYLNARTVGGSFSNVPHTFTTVVCMTSFISMTRGSLNIISRASFYDTLNSSSSVVPPFHGFLGC
jgi:hypothetical protein